MKTGVALGAPSGAFVEALNHWYVAPAPPSPAVTSRSTSPPSHEGLELTKVGIVGVGLTVIATVPAGDGQPFSKMINVYVPELAGVALAMNGFCSVELKPFGPSHWY